MPSEWTDFILMRDIYHCTPSELDEQDDAMIEMHAGFTNVSSKHSHIQSKREQQRAKLKQI